MKVGEGQQSTSKWQLHWLGKLAPNAPHVTRTTLVKENPRAMANLLSIKVVDGSCKFLGFGWMQVETLAPELLGRVCKNIRR